MASITTGDLDLDMLIAGRFKILSLCSSHASVRDTQDNVTFGIRRKTLVEYHNKFLQLEAEHARAVQQQQKDLIDFGQDQDIDPRDW